MVKIATHEIVEYSHPSSKAILEKCGWKGLFFKIVKEEKKINFFLF